GVNARVGRPVDAAPHRGPLAAVPLGDAAGAEDGARADERAADVERRTGAVVEDGHRVARTGDAAADAGPFGAVPACQAVGARNAAGDREGSADVEGRAGAVVVGEERGGALIQAVAE